jgi:hypothetical protein
MREVLTIKAFPAETALYFEPGNTSVGLTQRRCSRSTPGESEAEALMARGLSGRNPAGRGCSKSLNFGNSRSQFILYRSYAQIRNGPHGLSPVKSISLTMLLTNGWRFESWLRSVRGGGRGTKMADHLSPLFRPRLSLFSDHLRTVLAVKGSLRRAQQRRALDRSGPFRTTLLRRGKGSLRTALLAGDHFAAILVPFFAATDS